MATRRSRSSASGSGRDVRTGRFAPRGRGAFSAALPMAILAYEVDMINTVNDITREFGDEVLDYMRTEAPWEDRTTDARQGLGVDFEPAPQEATLTLYHTVEYGIFLELKNSGEYAIIMPTIETMGPELMRRLRAAL